ncbi:hypothetical protein [Mycolicibacterium brisbanense]
MRELAASRDVLDEVIAAASGAADESMAESRRAGGRIGTAVPQTDPSGTV